MTHRERLRTALAHQEPDHVPYDLGSMGATGIMGPAYQRFRQYLGLPEKPVRIWNVMTQLADCDEDLLQSLHVNVRRLPQGGPSKWKLEIVKQDGLKSYVDEWGITFCMPAEGGFYFDPRGHPLASAETVEDIERYPWPDPADPARFEGMVEQARRIVGTTGAGVSARALCPGALEIGQWLRGFDTFMMDLALNPDLAQALIEKITDLKIAYWDALLPQVKDWVDVVGESDDLGHQCAPLISLETYRKFLKPAHTRIFSAIRQHTDAPIFFHTCGSVYNFLPDLIEAGINILNPVQVSAAKMDTKILKREFGDVLTFWGGGCDTQRILPRGTLQEIRDEVKRRIDDLAPGGGFVFTPVHNIQADIPPENIMAMWEAWWEYGAYA